MPKPSFSKLVGQGISTDAAHLLSQGVGIDTLLQNGQISEAHAAQLVSQGIGQSGMGREIDTPSENIDNTNVSKLA